MFNIKINPFLYFLLFLAGITGEVTTIALSFFSVILHETAHLVTALGFGYRTLSIELFPFGGVARMEASLFNDPGAEAVTALAGPVESIILALLLKAFSPFLQLPLVTEDLVRINLALGLFNLLPLFPLDGGRILRSFLARTKGYKQATRLTTRWTKTVLYLTGVPVLWLSLRRILPLHFPLLLLFLLVAVREDNYFYSYLAQQSQKTVRLGKNGLLPSKVWVVETKRKVGDVLPFLTGKNYHLFFLIDKHGKILGEVSEEELVKIINQDNVFNLKIEEIWALSDRRPILAGGDDD